MTIKTLREQADRMLDEWIEDFGIDEDYYDYKKGLLLVLKWEEEKLLK